MRHIPKICYIATATILLYSYFQWSIIDIVTPFLIVFIAAPVYLCFIVALVSSVIYLFTKWRTLYYKAAIPFVTCFLGLVAIIAFPFVDTKINIDFINYKNQMEKVVEMVNSEELTPNVEHRKSLIRLPNGYRHLSKGGGEIVFGDNFVFFYTFRGILDNFSGYVFGHIDPKEVLSCDIIDNIRLNEDWSWISCS